MFEPSVERAIAGIAEGCPPIVESHLLPDLVFDLGSADPSGFSVLREIDKCGGKAFPLQIILSYGSGLVRIAGIGDPVKYGEASWGVSSDVPLEVIGLTLSGEVKEMMQSMVFFFRLSQDLDDPEASWTIGHALQSLDDEVLDYIVAQEDCYLPKE